MTARILRFPTSAAKSVGTTNYFRSCPVCGGSDGIVDEGMTQSGFATRTNADGARRLIC